MQKELEEITQKINLVSRSNSLEKNSKKPKEKKKKLAKICALFYRLKKRLQKLKKSSRLQRKEKLIWRKTRSNFLSFSLFEILLNEAHNFTDISPISSLISHLFLFIFFNSFHFSYLFD